MTHTACYPHTADRSVYAAAGYPVLPPARSSVFSFPGARRLLTAMAVTAILATGCAPGAMAPDILATPRPPVVAPEPSPEDSDPAPIGEPTSPAPTVVSSPIFTPTSRPTPTLTSSPVLSPEPSPSPEPQPTPAETETVRPEPEAPPAPPALLEQGASGDPVRDLQHRLLQLEWFDGKITGSYGDATRLAVEGFQTKRGLRATGAVDQATLDVLNAMTRQPTQDEMYNVLRPGPAILAPGSKGDDVKDLQARLKQIGWFHDAIAETYGPKTTEAVRGFQEKRQIPVTGEVDQRTLDRLYGMTRKPTSDELNNVVPEKAPTPAMVLDDRCLQGRVICISKSQRRLAWVIDGKIQSTMDVRFGSVQTPTRNGVFSVYWKSRDHVSSLYDSPMPFALFFSGGQAVHYSADFAARGYDGASHGCVNVRDKQAVMALFDASREGDKVVVYQ